MTKKKKKKQKLQGVSHPILRGPLSNLGLSAALSPFVVEPTHFRQELRGTTAAGASE